MFEVLRAQSSARVLESSLAVQEARFDDVRARRDVGFARPLDVSQIESQVADTRVDLVEAQRAATTGTALLAFLTGTELGTIEFDGAVDVPEELPPLDSWIESAHRRRQDVAAAEKSITAAERDVEVASGQWWPSVAVNLDVFLMRESPPSDQDWNGFIALNLPLFSAGRIRDDVRNAMSRLREARLAATLVQRAARRDVEVAWENLRASRERVQRLSEKLAATSEAFTQAESLYDAGLGTNLERLIAQDQRVASELALESARLDVRIFYLDLLRTAGALHEWIGLERPTGSAEEEQIGAEAR
jgi:outer membrane protein TolC